MLVSASGDVDARWIGRPSNRTRHRSGRLERARMRNLVAARLAVEARLWLLTLLAGPNAGERMRLERQP